MEYLSAVHIFINCQDFYIIGDTRRHAHLWQDSMNNKKIIATTNNHEYDLLVDWSKIVTSGSGLLKLGSSISAFQRAITVRGCTSC